MDERFVRRAAQAAWRLHGSVTDVQFLCFYDSSSWTPGLVAACWLLTRL